jgi:hypothetical protein
VTLLAVDVDGVGDGDGGGGDTGWLVMLVDFKLSRSIFEIWNKIAKETCYILIHVCVSQFHVAFN